MSHIRFLFRASHSSISASSIASLRISLIFSARQAHASNSLHLFHSARQYSRYGHSATCIANRCFFSSPCCDYPVWVASVILAHCFFQLALSFWTLYLDPHRCLLCDLSNFRFSNSNTGYCL